jgi:hypothetical protein
VQAALVESQIPDYTGGSPAVASSHSRRTRRLHRGAGKGVAVQIHPGHEFVPLERVDGLGGAQIPSGTLVVFSRPLTKLDKLKARKFTPIGREERVAKSLAALREPPPIEMTAADWRWLDEHSDIQDELE